MPIITYNLNNTAARDQLGLVVLLQTEIKLHYIKHIGPRTNTLNT